MEEEDIKIKERLNEIIMQQHSLTNKKSNKFYFIFKKSLQSNLDYLKIELENLKKKTQNIENQQNQAIEQENFEEAEQLEIILKQHYESVRRSLYIFNNIKI